jgi:Fe-S cluster assembly protein SufD
MTTLTSLINSVDESVFYQRYQRRATTTVSSWLQDIRKSGIDQFTATGYPTRRDEEWRFTPVGPIADTVFAEPNIDSAAAIRREDLRIIPFAELDCTTLVFVDGRYVPGLSTLRTFEDGVTVTNLADALANSPELVQPYMTKLTNTQTGVFESLNAALFEDGAFISIAKNQIIDGPIHLLHLSTSQSAPLGTFPRNLIVASSGSQSTIVETYVGMSESVYLTCPVTEVFVADTAIIDHYKLQQESLNAFHLGSMRVTLGRSSVFTSNGITLGGSISRNDISAYLGGEYAECTLNGLYLGNGRRIVDNHTTIDHAVPNCPSHEVYKGILTDNSRGVFNGKIFVRQDAQKTDAKQTNKTLLLSDAAQIFTKPQLEIFADDVRCTHGATIGQLDNDQLFYLRARGIGKEDARNLLVYAFASDIINRIKVEGARVQLDKQLFTQLAKVQSYEEAEHEFYEDA